MEAEFNSLAKRMREIHNVFKSRAGEGIPVQKRYFFYSGVVEIEMSQESLENLELDPAEIDPQFVKNKIEVAIMDETPFTVTEYGGYCSEVAGSVESIKVDLSGMDLELSTVEVE